MALFTPEEAEDVRLHMATVLSPGTLSELYDVGDVLGKGGFATVRVATTHEPAPHRVALKILNPRLYMSSFTKTKQLLNEISVLQQVRELKNPNLLHFVAAHEDIASTTGMKRLTIVTELCEGGELFDRIVTRGRYSEADAAALIVTLCKTLLALHRAGILHRDLKPENILYRSKDEDSDIVIADFGLARSTRLVDAHPGMVGTPSYVAPEVITHRNYTPAADAWGVGVLAYILLCGYPPFYGNTNEAVYRMICRGEFVFHDEAWAAVSASAKRFVTGLLTVSIPDRLTLEGALEHEWVRFAAPANTAHLPATVTNIKSFNARRKMRAAAAAVMWGAHRPSPMGKLSMWMRDRAVTTEEFNSMEKMFAEAAGKFDRISLATFADVMRKLHLDFLPLESVFGTFDTDSSGDIDYREFLVGIARLRSDVREALHMCFNLFDTNKDGHVSPTEFFSFLQSAESTTAPPTPTSSDAEGVFGFGSAGSSIARAAVGGTAAAPPSGTGHTPVATPSTVAASAAAALATSDEEGAAALEAKSSAWMELFQSIDADKDGVVTFDEFYAAVTTNTELARTLLAPVRRLNKAVGA